MNLSQLEQCIAEYGKEIYAFCRHLTGYTIEAAFGEWKHKTKGFRI